MLQSKHLVTNLVSGLVQGLFRAGHLCLIALGLFALSQVVPLAHTPTAGGSQIDAMGGASNGSSFIATQNNAMARNWLAELQFRVTQAFSSAKSNPAASAIAADSEPKPKPEIVVEEPDAPSPDVVRLSQYLANRYHVSDEVVESLVVRAREVGRELGVDPLLIVSVMAVESSFNPLAESRFGAQGLMQVIPKYHMEKIGEENGTLALFEPSANIRVGTMVLKEYITRTGSVESALQTYAGAANDPAAGYAHKVLGTRERLVQAMRS